MKNAGFVLSRKPTTEEREMINQALNIEDTERFWDGEGLTVHWDNNFNVGDFNGLIRTVFTNEDSINYL